MLIQNLKESELYLKGTERDAAVLGRVRGKERYAVEFSRLSPIAAYAVSLSLCPQYTFPVDPTFSLASLSSAGSSNESCCLECTWGDTGACRGGDDESTAFSYSPPSGTTQCVCSPPDTPCGVLPLGRDSSVFSGVTDEREEWPLPASVRSPAYLHCREREADRRASQFADLERAVVLLCSEWGETDTKDTLLGEEWSLWFSWFGGRATGSGEVLQEGDSGLETLPELPKLTELDGVSEADSGASRHLLKPPLRLYVPESLLA